MKHTTTALLLSTLLWLAPSASPADDRAESPAVLGGCLWNTYCDMVIEGGLVYLAAANGLVINDLSAPGGGAPLSSTYVPGVSVALCKEGDLVYIVTRTGGLFVYDVSYPQAPMLIGSNAGVINAKDVFVSDTVAAVVVNGGVFFLNVADPTSPTIVGSTTPPAPPQAVFVRDTLAYVAGDSWVIGGTHGLQIISIGDVTAPYLLSHTGSNLDYMQDIVVSGNYAYLACFYFGLRVADISNPAAPIGVGGGGYLDGLNSRSVALADTLALLTFEQHGGLITYDVSGPAPVDSLGGFLMEPECPRVCVVDQTAYLLHAAKESNPQFGCGYTILDISDPTSPTQTGEFVVPAGTVYDVCINGDLGVVGHEAGGVQIVGLSSPRAPKVIGQWPAPFRADAVAAFGAGAAAAGTSLLILDLTDPTQPDSIGAVALPGTASDIEIAANRAYIAMGNTGVAVCDLTDPHTPTVLGTIDTPDIARELVVRDTLVYVADYRSGIQIINAADPSNPTIIGQNNSIGLVFDIAVTGSVAWLAKGSLIAVDISDPTAPTPLSTYSEISAAYGLTLRDSLLYVTRDVSSIVVLNIADPLNPQPVDTFDTPGRANRLAFRDSIIVVADGTALLCLADETPATACCIGRHGNVDGLGDEGGEINVADLTYLVAYIFSGGSYPPCLDEGDVDGSGAINVSDLTYLVGYLFNGGQAPPDCP